MSLQSRLRAASKLRAKHEMGKTIPFILLSVTTIENRTILLPCLRGEIVTLDRWRILAAMGRTPAQSRKPLETGSTCLLVIYFVHSLNMTSCFIANNGTYHFNFTLHNSVALSRRRALNTLSGVILLFAHNENICATDCKNISIFIRSLF